MRVNILIMVFRVILRRTRWPCLLMVFIIWQIVLTMFPGRLFALLRVRVRRFVSLFRRNLLFRLKPWRLIPTLLMRRSQRWGGVVKPRVMKVRLIGLAGMRRWVTRFRWKRRLRPRNRDCLLRALVLLSGVMIILILLLKSQWKKLQLLLVSLVVTIYRGKLPITGVRCSG